jgi:pimeloyl-ACP methyl ester carboxylesterase
VSEELQMRVYGDASLPTLIYLPGLHGDWTLIGSFRRALGKRVRFVEVTYPRTLTWSLEEYATGVETALLERNIQRGWLLGESFSSQVVWPLITRNKVEVQGVILAGGFVRHPIRGAVRLAEKIAGNVPLSMITRIMFGYAKVARWRYRHSPETLADVGEFIARRTELDRQAAVHRLRLITRNDCSPFAQCVNVPVFALTGALDPIVPWFPVRGWLRKNCPALKEYKIYWGADHNVLSTAADASADQIVTWITANR